MKQLLLALGIILSITAMQAQHREVIKMENVEHQNMDRDEMEDRIKARKIAFITDKLELTSEQAQMFWPIYNEYNDKMRENKESLRELERENTSSTLMIEKHIQSSEKMARIQRQYVDKFRKVISDDQILELLKSDQRFKMKLIKEVKERVKNRVKE